MHWILHIMIYLNVKHKDRCNLVILMPLDLVHNVSIYLCISLVMSNEKNCIRGCEGVHSLSVLFQMGPYLEPVLIYKIKLVKTSHHSIYRHHQHDHHTGRSFLAKGGIVCHFCKLVWNWLWFGHMFYQVLRSVTACYVIVLLHNSHSLILQNHLLNW